LKIKLAIEVFANLSLAAGCRASHYPLAARH